MNLLCDISTFNPNHLFFLDTKKNMVIDGKFTKLVYSDSIVSLNGLYLYCPIDILHSSTTTGCDPRSLTTGCDHTASNARPVREKGRIMVRDDDGNPTLSVRESEDITSLTSRSSWSTTRYTNDQGYMVVTKKIPILFSILNPTNIQIMKELNRIEHEILEYYNEYFKINKVNVYSLRNQLKSGNIRVVHKVTTDVSDPKNYHTKRPLVVKISGIWETDMNVGITFKFQR
jgi:hypothetical protein